MSQPQPLSSFDLGDAEAVQTVPLPHLKTAAVLRADGSVFRCDPDLAAGALPIAELEPSGLITASPDAKVLAGADGRTVRCLNVQAAKVFRETLPAKVRGLVWDEAADGVVFVSGRSLGVLEAATGNVRMFAELPAPGGLFGRFRLGAVRIHLTEEPGTYVVTDGSAQAVIVRGGAASRVPLPGRCLCGGLADGAFFFGCDCGGVVARFGEKGNLLRQVPVPGQVRALACTPDGAWEAAVLAGGRCLVRNDLGAFEPLALPGPADEAVIACRRAELQVRVKAKVFRFHLGGGDSRLLQTLDWRAKNLAYTAEAGVQVLQAGIRSMENHAREMKALEEEDRRAAESTAKALEQVRAERRELSRLATESPDPRERRRARESIDLYDKHIEVLEMWRAADRTVLESDEVDQLKLGWFMDSTRLMGVHLEVVRDHHPAVEARKKLLGRPQTHIPGEFGKIIVGMAKRATNEVLLLAARPTCGDGRGALLDGSLSKGQRELACLERKEAKVVDENEAVAGAIEDARARIREHQQELARKDGDLQAAKAQLEETREAVSAAAERLERVAKDTTDEEAKAAELATVLSARRDDLLKQEALVRRLEQAMQEEEERARLNRDQAARQAARLQGQQDERSA